VREFWFSSGIEVVKNIARVKLEKVFSSETLLIFESNELLTFSFLRLFDMFFSAGRGGKAREGHRGTGILF
jgi:hypothetical protein